MLRFGEAQRFIPLCVTLFLLYSVLKNQLHEKNFPVTSYCCNQLQRTNH